MSHTPWLLVWVLSQCRLKARYSHSSFPPITYKKRESASHTQLHDYTKAHSSTLFSFLHNREKETFTAEGITNASDCISSNMGRSSRIMPVIWTQELPIVPRLFIQLTVKIYQKLCLCLDPMELVSLWGDIISQLAHPVIDFLFKSQLKSIKNSVCCLDSMDISSSTRIY